MKCKALIKVIARVSILAWALLPSSVLACAACFGKSDSALAQGMNMGIFALLAVIGSVLATISAFFVVLARRAARVTSAEATEIPTLQTTTKDVSENE